MRDGVTQDGQHISGAVNWITSKTAMTKTAANQTKMATVKVQNGHTPKQPKQKRPHQK